MKLSILRLTLIVAAVCAFAFGGVRVGIIVTVAAAVIAVVTTWK